MTKHELLFMKRIQNIETRLDALEHVDEEMEKLTQGFAYKPPVTEECQHEAHPLACRTSYKKKDLRGLTDEDQSILDDQKYKDDAIKAFKEHQERPEKQPSFIYRLLMRLGF